MSYWFKPDLVSTNLNFQSVSNTIPWADRSILTSFRLCKSNSHLVSKAVPWAVLSILTLFRPIWIFRTCVPAFHKLLIEYWPRFHQYERQDVKNTIRVMPFSEPLIQSWSRFYRFELTGSMSRYPILWVAHPVLTSFPPLLNSQLVRNAILWAAHSLLTYHLKSQLVRNAIPWQLIQYWPRF